MLEIAYGYQLRASEDLRYLELLKWWTRMLASDAFAVVALDGRAALIAGRLRGRMPHAPPARRGDRRSKLQRQASWLLDMQIASTAYAAGLDVVTENRGDFETISTALVALFPGAPELAVLDSPM